MKKTTVTTLLFLLYSVISFSQQDLLIDTNKSAVNWKSSMLFSFGGHHGTVKFIEGKFIKENNKFTGGNFTVDMTTIINTDGDYSKDLVNHLKNEDFFNVEEFPTSKLKITNVEYYDNGAISMKADLTIKGITKPVMFELEEQTKNQINARFKIDRTDWNITYGSKGFIKIKDYAISDAIEFEVKLILK